MPGDVQPEFDRSPEGTICWVTGQGATPGSIGEADIDGGRTSLVSPYFSTAGMADPTFGAWTWFYTTDVGAADYLRSAAAQGGVAVVDGRMIDAPVVRAAERIIALAARKGMSTQ